MVPCGGQDSEARKQGLPESLHVQQESWADIGITDKTLLPAAHHTNGEVTAALQPVLQRVTTRPIGAIEIIASSGPPRPGLPLS